MDEREFLKTRTHALITIALTLTGLFAVFLLHRFLPSANKTILADRFLSVFGLLGTTIFAVALPILLRTGFYQKGIKQKGLTQADFSLMKGWIVYSVGLGEIFLLFSYFVPIYTNHLYLSVLVGIYGLYSIFPSRETYRKELRSFGVLDENT
jgi:hypothetical protein